MNIIDFFLAVSNGEIDDEKAVQFIKKQTNGLDENSLESLFNEFRAFIFSDIHFMSYEGFDMPEFKSKNCEGFLKKIHSYMPNHELITEDERAKEKSIYKTLNKVNEGKYSELERIDLIESLTGNDLDKLKALNNDISEFLFIESKKYRDNITEEMLNELIKTYESKDIEPPLELRLFDPVKIKWRERTEDESLDFESGEHNKEEYLDIEKAFYPDAFFNVNLFKYQVEQYINKLEPGSKSETIQRNNIQPIHWLKGEESLRQFLDTIKSAGLIESRETDEIIQEHFRQTDQSPQPIQWSRSNRLLIYLFNKLTEAGLVDTMDRQFQLITEHFKNKKGQALKADNLKSDSYNMKTFYTSDPKGSETIDRIIQELTD